MQVSVCRYVCIKHAYVIMYELQSTEYSIPIQICDMALL